VISKGGSCTKALFFVFVYDLRRQMIFQCVKPASRQARPVSFTYCSLCNKTVKSGNKCPLDIVINKNIGLTKDVEDAS